MYQFLKKKLLWELDKLAGFVQLPFRKEDLIARLSASISELSIETTNICNANCTFCAYQYQERPTGVMSMELFRKLIDEYVECGGGPLNLTPTVGEPLADKHVLERLRYVRERPQITAIGMYSNMINLARVGAEELVESGLSGLVVSTSGLDEAMYERVYRSKMYRKMLANVKAFAVANNARGRPVDLKVDMRIDRPIAEVTAYPDSLEMAALIGKENLGVKFRYDSWSGRITRDQLTGTMKLRSPLLVPKLSACSELYTGPMVYWDGRVGACGCRDLDASDLIIGDATTRHLGDIWFGAEIQKLRDEFMTDRRKPICDSCTHYNGLSNLLKPSRKGALPHGPSPYVPGAVAGAAPARRVSLPILSSKPPD